MPKEKSNQRTPQHKATHLRGLLSQKTPHWLIGLLAQTLLIIFSVLLALNLNEWSEEAKRQEQVAVAIDAIKSEMQQNLRKLEKTSSYHLGIYDTLSYYSDQNQRPPSDLYLSGLFTPADLPSTAWETMVQTGIVDELSYELALSLSKIYSYQNRYESLGNSIVQESYINIINMGSEKFLGENYENWAFVVKDFSSREEVLQKQLSEILNQLEVPPKSKP